MVKLKTPAGAVVESQSINASNRETFNDGHQADTWGHQAALGPVPMLFVFDAGILVTAFFTAEF